MTHTIQVVILGLLLGGVYALMASGLTLMFGVMRIVNLAHGAFIVVAAYMAYLLFQGPGWDPFLSLVVIMPAMFLLGVLIYRFLFPPIESSPRFGEMTVLLTFAVALIVEGLLGFFFTGTFRTTDPPYSTEAILIGDLFIPKAQLYASITSLVLLAGLGAFLRLTRTGYAVRATMQNRTAAQIVGVNVRGVSTLSFGIGMALAGASGSLISFLFPFFPNSHWRWIAILLSLIVLGGLGSIKGAVIGALLLAVTAALISDQFGPTWSPMTFFGALFLILLIRPRGLFGQETRV
ncbi:MAG TPA: branched-chain amino acid ABC transporter permease [Acidimicrobiia bacterium]|nr:branched-chain amino acid ABC transporter permease [Acidimicrobiia bacterium]